MSRTAANSPVGGHAVGSTSQTYPATALLATSFLLAGLGTVVLGPLLPQLLREWQLSDGRGGLLLLAKFVGAFAGGALVPRRLRLGVLAGHALAAVGFAGFALAPGLPIALPALFLTGLGLGEIIASTNILTGQRWADHAGSALALLNFFWSLGAVATGLIAAALLPRLGWRGPVLGLAALFALSGTLLFSSRGHRILPAQPADATEAVPVTLRLSLLYGGLLFLYGGLETCLTGWLTTFSLRFAGGHILAGQSGFVVLWAALTAGRVVASALMRRVSERLVQRLSLLLCLGLIVALARSSGAGSLALICVLLGLALAPVFPSTFGLYLRRGVPPGTAGRVLAVSGLGAALFPWLMGVVSTHFGSLRLAMAVPALLVPTMLLLSFMDRPTRDRFPASSPKSGGEDLVNRVYN